MTLSEAIEVKQGGASLDREQAQAAMGELLAGAGDEAIRDFLTVWHETGPTPPELAGFTDAMLAVGVTVDAGDPPVVDIVGTGGGKPTFNISTAAAILASAAGVKVAKHGNRAVTGACGSADVLEAIGVTLAQTPEALSRSLAEHRLAFLFAPAMHPELKRVGPIRKSLPFRTVFNMLGPLASPVSADRRLIGVWDRALIRRMAEALQLLGVERAFVVHSEDGLDEISPCATTYVAHLHPAGIEEIELTPGSFGLFGFDPSGLNPADGVAGNAAILMQALSKIQSPRFSAAAPSAASALYLAGMVASVEQGIEYVKEAVLSGAALEKLDALRASSAR
ncbi:MAG: anthranilate phosphoribosyltransferase [Fimbriimonadaceae bacterium]